MPFITKGRNTSILPILQPYIHEESIDYDSLPSLSELESTSISSKESALSDASLSASSSSTALNEPKEVSLDSSSSGHISVRFPVLSRYKSSIQQDPPKCFQMKSFVPSHIDPEQNSLRSIAEEEYEKDSPSNTVNTNSNDVKYEYYDKEYFPCIGYEGMVDYFPFQKYSYPLFMYYSLPYEELVVEIKQEWMTNPSAFYNDTLKKVFNQAFFAKIQSDPVLRKQCFDDYQLKIISSRSSTWRKFICKFCPSIDEKDKDKYALYTSCRDWSSEPLFDCYDNEVDL